MQKRRVKNYGSPFIRNANLIGAGNKFTALRDENGIVQWKLSVVNQGTQKPNLPTFKDKVQQLAKAQNPIGNGAIKTPIRNVSRR